MSHLFASDSWIPHWANDDLILIDVEGFARARPARGGREGGTTTGGPSQSVYVSGDPLVSDGSEFNVRLVYQGTWTDDLKSAFARAAEAISDYILGDIPSAGGRRSAIDDISISAQLSYIDGVGGVLGQAGPTSVRAGSFLPATGTMAFDSADAGYYNSTGLFDDIVLHEMLHTIGFGTVWSELGLYSGGSFNGARANAAYPGTGLIPVELDGGAGTAWSHWDEETFFNELMTGYIDGDNYLSYTTIASLGDLGYTTVSGASYAQPWFI